ncbi:MAG: ArsR/SmtB family transcription factor [Haloferacaceae archaeon]
MEGNHGRLERLLETELGECCEGDVRERLRALEDLAAALPDDPSADLAVLGALGGETRYRLVRLLAAAEGDLCVCELSPLVDVSDSAVSHALSDLADAGLVARRKEGAWRYYDATERAERLLDALDATRGTA